MKFALSCTLALAAASLGACSSMKSSSESGADTDAVILPNAGAGALLEAGCWARFYDERNFDGSSLTLVGPIELETLDKGTAKQLKRDIKSVVTGSSATLVLYQKQLFSSRSVGFSPNSREPGLVEKLGFGGQIESMKLRCNG